MSDTLYKKVGKRYIEVGSDTRLRCDGVWLVYRTRTGKRQSCVLITDEMPKLPMISFHVKQDELTYLLMAHEGISVNDLADKICTFFSQEAARGK